MKYKYFKFIFTIIIFTTLQANSVYAEGFLHTRGHDIVDEAGNKILLRGVGLGNWLLPEGYMWKFGEGGDRPRKIEKIVSDLIGEQEAEKFWLEFRKNYITEADIQRIAELGFNSVRPALNARRFLTETENPVYVEEGFELLDSLISWCGKYNIYVIIDMHGAPGGQTGANIDDSPKDEPELFIDVNNQDRLVDLWVKIADRYKNNPTVAAYDLLNEPLPKVTGAADKYKHLLEPLYKRLTEAIRKVDDKHMITLEGFDWSNDWSVFSAPFDKNVFYQFHYYCWDRPTNLKSVNNFIERRKELNTPVWVGETGEKDNTIYFGTTQYFEKNNIGWSFWPWKKMDTKNTPYSISMPDAWDQIAEYSRGGNKPDKETALAAFNQLIENIKLKNCVFFPDVVNSIFRRAPLKVEAENYGHDGFNQSYYVADTTRSSEYYRTSEPVQIKLIESKEKQRNSEQYIFLSQNEWTAYKIFINQPENLSVSIKVKSDKLPTRIVFIINSIPKEIELTGNDWETIELQGILFAEGINEFKLKCLNGTADIDWIDIK